MTIDQKMQIRIELRVDETTKCVMPCICLSKNASNVLVSNGEVLWMPSFEEMGFLEKSFELVVKRFLDDEAGKTVDKKSVETVNDSPTPHFKKCNDSSPRIEHVQTTPTKSSATDVELNLSPRVQTKDRNERLVCDVDPDSGALRHHIYEAGKQHAFVEQNKVLDEKSIIDRVLEKQKKRRST